LESITTDYQYAYSPGPGNNASSWTKQYTAAGTYTQIPSASFKETWRYKIDQTCVACGQKRTVYNDIVMTAGASNPPQTLVVVEPHSVTAPGMSPVSGLQDTYWLKMTAPGVDHWVDVTATTYPAVSEQQLGTWWTMGGTMTDHRLVPPDHPGNYLRISATHPKTVRQINTKVPATYMSTAWCGPGNGPPAYKTITLHVIRAEINTPNGDPRLDPNSNGTGANGSNERVFGTGADPVCQVVCTALYTPLSDRLRWRVTPVPGSVLTWWNNSLDPASATGKGTGCIAEYRGLPSQKTGILGARR